MANLFDRATKANRLVTGRRYGNIDNSTTDNQEPFTSTIDISAGDVYTQANLLPTSSLPFSGSSQNGYYLLADGTINDGTAGQPANAIAKYWYRHELTETKVNDQSVYFFMQPPGTLNVQAEQADWQAVENRQVVNFISNKYASGSLSLNVAEDTASPGNPGYNVRVSFLNAAQLQQGLTNASAVELPPDQWSFDYKTGVLQISNTSNISTTTTSTRVYITAYQYIGKTLNTTLTDLQSQIDNIDGTGGGSGNYISSSNGNNIVSASNEGILVQGSYNTAPVTIANLSTISASFGVSVVANAGFTGSLQGTSSWATIAVSASVTDNTATNTTYYPVFVGAAGNQALNIDTTTLSYNPSTNILTTTASNAFTASNITNAFVSSVAPNNQILISNGAGQVTGSSLFSFNPAIEGGQLIAGGVTLDHNSFVTTQNTFDFGFGNIANAIQITNAGNSATGLITFNLSASFAGPTTFTNASNATFDDQFILLGSGSSQTPGGHKDSGIVFEYGDIIGTGSALFFDGASSKRLAFRYSASVSDLAMDPQAFVNMTFVQGLNGSITSRADVDTLFNQVGGDNTAAHTMKGFMFIDSDGNIYIKA